MNTSRIVLTVALLSSAVGCAGALTRDVAASAPPAAIHATLQSMSDRDNQRLMVQVLDSPEMHNAVRAFASEIADGTLTSLSEPERVARIEQMSNEYVTSLTRTITRSMALGLRQDLAPAIAVTVREAVASTLHEALSEGYQHDMQRVAAGLTEATVQAATQGLAEGMRQNIGPALHDTLNSPETSNAVGVLARTLAREAVLGSNDAMTAIQRAQSQRGGSTFLGRITAMTTNGVRLFEIIAAVAVLLALGLGVWAARLLLRSRRAEAENERSAASALLFAEAMREAENKPWGSELGELLKQRMKGEKVGDLIDQILGEKKSSRGSTTPPRKTHPTGRLSFNP